MGTMQAKPRARLAPPALRFGWPAAWGVSLGVAGLAVCYFAVGAELVAGPSVPQVNFSQPERDDVLLRLGPAATPLPAGALKDFGNPLIEEPAPTPPPPLPPPPPPRLSDAIRNWSIDSLDESEAGIKDERSGERFILHVGGKPRSILAANDSPLDVELIAVDMQSETATFGGAGQEESIQF